VITLEAVTVVPAISFATGKSASAPNKVDNPLNCPDVAVFPAQIDYSVHCATLAAT